MLVMLLGGEWWLFVVCEGNCRYEEDVWNRNIQM